MAEAPPEKKKLPVRTIAIVAVMLVVEGAAVVGIMMMFGGPSEVVAQPGLFGAASSPEMQPAEIPLMQERLTNNASGRIFIYDTEIQIVTQERHRETVQGVMDSRMASIRTGISRIFAAAEHSYFAEPGLETLTRQVTEFLHSIFPEDGEGEEIIVSVLIPKCMGFPADY
jgi:flagellar basal body-associated protein FliL